MLDLSCSSESMWGMYRVNELSCFWDVHANPKGKGWELFFTNEYGQYIEVFMYYSTSNFVDFRVSYHSADYEAAVEFVRDFMLVFEYMLYGITDVHAV